MTNPTILSSLGDFTVQQLLGIPAASVTLTTGSGTLNAPIGKITTVALTTAAQASASFTISDSFIAAGDMVLAGVANGTNSAGQPVVSSCVVSAGQVVVKIANVDPTNAFNGTLVITLLWIPYL